MTEETHFVWPAPADEPGQVRVFGDAGRKQHQAHISQLSDSAHHSIQWSRAVVVAVFLAALLIMAFSIAKLSGMSNPLRHSSDICTPRGIHLAPRTDVTNGVVSVTVSFFLPYSLCRNARPIVYYERKGRERHGSAAQQVQPLYNNYTSRNTDGETFSTDLVFHVELPKLQGGEQNYWYRIEVEASADEEQEEDSSPRMRLTRSMFRAFRKKPISYLGVSPNQYFKTPPLPGSPTSIAIVADWGDTIISRQTFASMINASLDEENPISQVIVAGDITYADGEPSLWSEWFQDVQPLFQHVPLTVSVGNHEVECDINTLEVFS